MNMSSPKGKLHDVGENESSLINTSGVSNVESNINESKLEISERQKYLRINKLFQEYPRLDMDVIREVCQKNDWNLTNTQKHLSSLLGGDNMGRIQMSTLPWVVSTNISPGKQVTVPIATNYNNGTNKNARLASILSNSNNPKPNVLKPSSIFQKYRNRGINPSDQEESLNNRRSVSTFSKFKVAEISDFKENGSNLKTKSKLQRQDPSSEDEEVEAGMTDEDSEISSDDEYIQVEKLSKREQQRKDFLKFINESADADIADLADIPIKKAQRIISSRPFSDFNSFIVLNFPVADDGEEKSSTKRKRKVVKTDGERIFEKATKTLQGYTAIESLIKKCNNYGTAISNEIEKWGLQKQVPDSEDFEGANGEIGMDFLVVGKQNDVAEIKADEINEDEPEEIVIVSPPITPAKKVETIKSDEEEFETDNEFLSEPENDDDEFDAGDYFEEEDEYDEDEDNEDEDDEDMIPTKRRKVILESSPTKTELKTSNIVVSKTTQMLDLQKGAKSTEFFNTPPKYLSKNISLKDYQLSGINWMYLLYINGLSCILGDEMGLGKSCQVISFLAYLSQKKEHGPHLIVVPSSTLENWLREFEKFCPRLKVVPYYGSQAEREELRYTLEDVTKYDVLVTTYNLAAGSKADQSFLAKRGFNCVVFDEGHMLKNSMSERFEKLIKIKANFRVLLTGTPLQNNLRELISLLNFIMPSLFYEQKEALINVFKQKATTNTNEGYNPLLAQEALQRAKQLMKPFILRRRKQQVLKHLPAKHIKVVHCDMVEHQKKQYSLKLKEMVESKTNETKKARTNWIMQLRKLAIHPGLSRNYFNDGVIDKMSSAILKEPYYRKDGNKQYIMEDMEVMSDLELNHLCLQHPRTLKRFGIDHNELLEESGKVKAMLDLLNKIVVKKGEKLLIFSMFTQVLDIIGKVLENHGHKFLRLDGQTSVNERQTLIDQFYNNENIKVFILSTKAGGFGINLVVANNVLIFDQSFNPHDDAQAMDRAHRVGQTKEVNVFTLIANNTIEEKIYNLAQNKLQLDKHISKEGDNNSEKAASDPSSAKIDSLLKGIMGEALKDTNVD
ncbi:hypothetical protein QEN19_000564 [Hanseniaspora menglaensis]